LDDRPVGFEHASHRGVPIDAPRISADKSCEQLNIFAFAPFSSRFERSMQNDVAEDCTSATYRQHCQANSDFSSDAAARR
jgi:hypothetical protein